MVELPPRDELIAALLRGGLLPGGVAALVVAPLVAWRSAGESARRVLGAIALAAGFGSGLWALGYAPLRPESTWHWLPWLAGGALLVGLIPRPWSLRLLLGLAVAVVAAWKLVPPPLEGEETLARNARLLTGAGVFALWLLEPVVCRQPGRTWPLLLALAAGGGGAVLLLAGWGIGAQVAGALAAALTGIALLSGREVAHGLLPGVAVLLPGLMVSGKFFTFSEVPAVSFILPAAAPLVVGLLTPLPRGRVASQTFAVLTLLGIAVALAARATEEPAATAALPARARSLS